MSSIKIKLNKIEEIVKFVEMAKTINSPLILKSGRNEVNAVSLLGIFTLDLCKELTLICDNESENLECFSIFQEN